jgi:predicted nuclease of restriction endonuclease-like (RecB) superfamily
MDPDLVHPAGYKDALRTIKKQVQTSRRDAQRIVNTELVGLYWNIGRLVGLYWNIGRTVLDQQQKYAWGSRVVDHLAADLRSAFPDMKGLSRSNLYYMRSFARAWPLWTAEVPQAVGLLPWGHIRVLLDKVDSQRDRDWYAEAAAENGWSRNVLEQQISNRLIDREGNAPSNFAAHLAKPDSAMAHSLTKDPFVFDFLALGPDVDERHIEQALMDRMVEVLRELGPGWAFVDRQRHIEVDGQDFYIDLLFFHVEQLRYIVVELKAGPFTPEQTGQLGFYVSIVDDLIKKKQHAPTVGILLVSDKSEAVVRYALSGTSRPLAVSSYTYEALPDREKDSLPAAERLKRALSAPIPGKQQKSKGV